MAKVIALSEAFKEDVERVFQEQNRRPGPRKRKTAVRQGKRVRLNVPARRRFKPLSSRRRQALRKARRKAQTSKAKLKRKRSNKVRRRLRL